MVTSNTFTDNLIKELIEINLEMIHTGVIVALIMKHLPHCEHYENISLLKSQKYIHSINLRWLFNISDASTCFIRWYNTNNITIWNDVFDFVLLDSTSLQFTQNSYNQLSQICINIIMKMNVTHNLEHGNDNFDCIWCVLWHITNTCCQH